MKKLFKRLLVKYCILKEKRLLALMRKDKDWEMYKVEIDKYCDEHNKDYITKEEDLMMVDVNTIKIYSEYLTTRINDSKLILKYQKSELWS